MSFSEVTTPYSFVQDSYLIQTCMTIGNACDLGIEGQKKAEFVEDPDMFSGRWLDYGPHNLDTLKQAYTLFLYLIVGIKVLMKLLILHSNNNKASIVRIPRKKITNCRIDCLNSDFLCSSGIKSAVAI